MLQVSPDACGSGNARRKISNEKNLRSFIADPELRAELLLQSEGPLGRQISRSGRASPDSGLGESSEVLG
jgi:hypothetical protein